MTAAPDYEASLREANRGLREATSADEVREVWRRHVGALGHRTLGRLLIGQAADRLLERRLERSAPE